MNVFPDIQFFLYIPVFLLAIFLAFFVPGDLLLKKWALPFVPRFTLSTILGICLWALVGLVFGYLNLRVLSYVYFTTVFIVWLLKHRKFELKIHFDKLSLLIIVFGGIIQLSAVWFMGFRQTNGSLLFCCRSVPDAIYHLSLTNELINHFPPMEPGSAGVVVKNYHYLANLVLADLVRVFHLPLIPTVYQYSSILLILLLAGSAVTISNLLNAPRKFLRLFLFFLFFSGDINYLLIFLTTRKIDFSFTILDNAALFLTGPPRSFSVIIFFALISLIILWLKEKHWLLGIVVAIMTGTLVGFKVYTAVPAFVGLGFVTLYLTFIKKQWKMALPIIMAAILGLAIYLPVNSGAGGLVFTGWWRFENFIDQPQFNLISLENARQAYAAIGVWPKAIIFEIFFLLIYLIFNLGTEILLFLPIKKAWNLFPKQLSIYLFVGIASLLFFGLFFVQSTGGANTVQFIITLTIIGSMPVAAIVLAIYEKLPKKLAMVFIMFIIIFTGLRAFVEFKENALEYKNWGQFSISKNEQTALNFLSKEKPQNAMIAIHPSLAKKFISQYVPLFTSHPVFLAGISDHNVAGLNQRILDNEKFFLGGTKSLGVKFLYYPKKKDRLIVGETIFENDDIIISKISPD